MTPQPAPQYRLDDFVAACGAPQKARVLGSASTTAATDWGLRTQDSILAWIAGGGIEKPAFVSSRPWENNPHKPPDIMVDSYDFYSGTDYGYLAFMFQPRTKLWLLKSLKKNEKPAERAFVLGEKLRALGITPKKEG